MGGEVAWDEVCLPTVEWGLGVCDGIYWNRAFVLKVSLLLLVCSW